MAILGGIGSGRWRWVSSDIAVTELARTPDLEKREFLLAVVRRADYHVSVRAPQSRRAEALSRLAIEEADALHTACAEAGGAQVFLTVDDVLLTRLRRLEGRLRFAVRNPSAWLREVQT
jgi:hypothetical protein